MVAAGESIASVKKRMEGKGLKLGFRRWGEIFDNAFYAGLIVHGLLEYEPIKAVHPPIVSLDIWEQVKNIRDGKRTIQSHKETGSFFPLKGFVRCVCGRQFTAYQAKKKSRPKLNLFYYKCTDQKCRTNVSAKKAEEAFRTILSKIALNSSLQGPFIKMLKLTYLNYQKEALNKRKKLEQSMKEYEEKKIKLVDKFISDDLDKATYEEFKAILEANLAQAQHEYRMLQLELSNPVEALEFSTNLAQNLHLIWKNGGIETKRKLQDLVFPQGVLLDKQTMRYRTSEINLIFSLTNSESVSIAHKKSEETSNNADYSASVPGAELLKVFNDFMSLIMCFNCIYSNVFTNYNMC